MTIEGTHFVFTSGQTVDDVAKYSPEPNVLKIAQQILESCHLAPSAPDTLCITLYRHLIGIGCYPFSDLDPFILTTPPHCFVIGNQDNFGTASLGNKPRVVLMTSCFLLDNGTRIVVAPSFEKTGQIVLLNLRDLSCQTVEF